MDNIKGEENENYLQGFEDLWRQVNEEAWSFTPLADATVRITAEGVEMTYAAAPTDDADVYGLAAIIGSVAGLPDEGAMCEDALAWNAAHEVTLSLVGDGTKLRASILGDARRLDAGHLRDAIRQVADTVAAWRGRTNAATEGGAE